MPVIAVIGGQWGQEGCGRIIDFYAQHAKVVVRCQSVHNGDQTIINERGEFHLRMLPPSIFYPQMVSVIGNGVIVDPVVLLDEIEMVQRAGLGISRLVISDRAHVIMPYHILLDRMDEEMRGDTGTLGTRARGVRQAHADKMLRMGITLGDLLNEELLLTKLSQTLAIKNRILTRLHNLNPLPLNDIYRQYLGYGNRLAKYIIETGRVVQRAIDKGHTVVLENGSGVLLDPDYGTYPFVGGSPSSAAGLVLGGGLGPTQLTSVIGVFKAYSAQNGMGPMPTEIRSDESRVAESIRMRGKEYVIVTGDPYRVGWFDAVAANFMAQINGMTSMALTHLDVLDELEEVKICTAYRVGETEYLHMPASAAVLQRVEPVYETLPGWQSDTSRVRSFSDLPSNARAYVQRIEEVVKTPVTLISVGRRNELLQMHPLAAIHDA